MKKGFIIAVLCCTLGGAVSLSQAQADAGEIWEIRNSHEVSHIQLKWRSPETLDFHSIAPNSVAYQGLSMTSRGSLTLMENNQAILRYQEPLNAVVQAHYTRKPDGEIELTAIHSDPPFIGAGEQVVLSPSRF